MIETSPRSVNALR